MSESIRGGKDKGRMTTAPLAIVAGLAMLGSSAFLAGVTASAQDAAKVDPKHYKVEFENAQVRVLRITYGPHEKSVMHSHPPGVVVYLTDASGKFTMPGGATIAAVKKAGTVSWVDSTVHLPENTGDKPFELIEVELKGKPIAAK